MNELSLITYIQFDPHMFMVKRMLKVSQIINELRIIYNHCIPNINPSGSKCHRHFTTLVNIHPVDFSCRRKVTTARGKNVDFLGTFLMFMGFSWDILLGFSWDFVWSIF